MFPIVIKGAPFALLLTLLLALLSVPALADDAYWIDVRTPEEYAAGHVSGAVNIPYEVIGQRISEVTEDRDAVIYLYCRSGRRSGIALDTLTEAGYSNAINAGGLEDAQQLAAKLQACAEGSPADC